MVALKPGSAQSRASPAGKKQERRGGIETLNCLLTPPALERGSRNAVVALKPYLDPSVGIGGHRKQERRGGIETRETNRTALPSSREAGTPWWH